MSHNSREHHQTAIVEEYPNARHGAHSPRWTDIIHPKVSLIVVGSLTFFAVMLFLFWAIPHHDETVSLSTVLWHAILGLLTLALTWIGPVLLVAAALGLVIRWNIKPLLECGHQFQGMLGQRARNKVLAQEQDYAVFEVDGRPEFRQVWNTPNVRMEPPQIAAPAAPQIAAPAEVPTGRQLLLDGSVERALTDGYLILGMGQDGKIKKLKIKRCFSTLISGLPSVGKTTTVFWITGQLTLIGAKLWIVDPHMYFQDDEGNKSLAAELAELSDSFVFPPCDGPPEQVVQRLKWTYQQLRKRQQPGYIVRAEDTIIAIMDEFNSVADSIDPKLVVVVHEGRELNFAQTLALIV